MGKNTIGDVNGEIINIIQNSGIFSKYISNDNKIELSKDLDITPPPLPAKVIKRKSLIENIQSDLFPFSHLLASFDFFNIKEDVSRLQQKEEYKNLQNMSNGIIYTNDLNKKIREFVIAIQNKNINFFNQLSKENRELYDELLNNFEENMIAQPLLSEYFNIVNQDIIFEENSYLLDFLKQEYEMFKITPDDKSKYNGKKRYKIF